MNEGHFGNEPLAVYSLAQLHLPRTAMQLVLASSSPYRRELLERFGVPFVVRPPDVDESPLPGEAPEALARRLAVAKARRVAERCADAVVVGSDQVASLDGRVLGKPGTVDRAVRQLASCSGRRVRFLTGLAVVRGGTLRTRTRLDVTTARFRRFDAGRAERYVRRDQPLDCAGGIRFEGLGPLLLEGVDTADPSAAIGLPLIALGELLRLEGLDPLGVPLGAERNK